MIKKSTLIKLVTLLFLAASISTAQAAVVTGNFICPEPYEVQSTDFTTPSIWVAPPVAHSAHGQVGVGLGGGKALKLIGAQEAEVKHKKGWVCVYDAETDSINFYETKIKQLADSNKYLRKYLKKVKEEFKNAEPFLKDYPQDRPLGFIGYQKAEK